MGGMAGGGRDAVRRVERWEGGAFAAGSLCFLIAPFPAFLHLVGGLADAIVFFVGSLLFTTGGALQTLQAAPDRRGPGRAAWDAAALQSLGTVAFNVSTGAALVTAVAATGYDRLVWRPDAVGSAFFLLSGAVGYAAAPRHRLRLVRGGRGWWLPGVNLLGCVWFGIAAVAGYVAPATGSLLAPAVADWTTSAGAACFLACALAALRPAAGGRVSRVDAARRRASAPGRPR
jgi:hypothetical protein